jgi:hypothetical protein
VLTLADNYVILIDMKYKFDEDRACKELTEYINTTYNAHYSTDKYQATDMIIDAGHGEGFCMGNIMKYAKRYGRKGGKNRADLMKILHYGIIMLYVESLNDEIE